MEGCSAEHDIVVPVELIAGCCHLANTADAYISLPRLLHFWPSQFVPESVNMISTEPLVHHVERFVTITATVSPGILPTIKLIQEN